MERIARSALILMAAAVVWIGSGAAQPAYAVAVSYEYDARGRLIQVTYPDGTIVEYEYDDAGNRLIRRIVHP